MLFKVVVGLGLLIGAGVLALTAGPSTAAAKEGEKDKDKEKKLPPALPADLKKKMDAALAAGDPIAMRRLADQIEKAGFPEQAKSLREAADAIAKAVKAVPDPPPPTTAAPAATSAPSAPIVRTPAEQPKRGPDVFAAGQAGTVTATPEKLTYIVQKGDGFGKIARKLTGNESRWPELVKANPHKKYKKTAIGLEPVTLFAGEKLNLPESWRDALPKVEGDAAQIDERGARRLAGRVALEITKKPKGSENRDLIATFQQVERQRGMHGVPVSGVFDYITALSLARNYGIVPPLKFADGKDIYWPVNAAPAKRKLKEIFSRMAARDPSRTEEWTQAAQVL